MAPKQKTSKSSGGGRGRGRGKRKAVAVVTESTDNSESSVEKNVPPVSESTKILDSTSQDEDTHETQSRAVSLIVF